MMQSCLRQSKSRTVCKDALVLESESDDVVEEADNHQELHNWCRASGDPDDDTVPLDVQLSQLQQTIQGLYKTVKAKVRTTIGYPYSLTSISDVSLPVINCTCKLHLLYAVNLFLL